MSDRYHNITVPPDREFCPHLARAEAAELDLQRARAKNRQLAEQVLHLQKIITRARRELGA